MPDSIGYRCDGCGEQFLYKNHETNAAVLRAVWDHIDEEHGGKETADTITQQTQEA